MVSMVFVRYILVAGVAYGIDFGGYIFLLHLGYKPVIANMMIKNCIVLLYRKIILK